MIIEKTSNAQNDVKNKKRKYDYSGDGLNSSSDGFTGETDSEFDTDVDSDNYESEYLGTPTPIGPNENNVLKPVCDYNLANKMPVIKYLM
nr:12530_t:CDS:2 [Entrophospora candida]